MHCVGGSVNAVTNVRGGGGRGHFDHAVHCLGGSVAPPRPLSSGGGIMNSSGLVTWLGLGLGWGCGVRVVRVRVKVRVRVSDHIGREPSLTLPRQLWQRLVPDIDRLVDRQLVSYQ